MSGLPTIAVVGANGFIGTRIVEKLHLEGCAVVRPVVRRASALASAARFRLESHIADALDETGLRGALAGCDFVVHAVAGDGKTIEGSIEPIYRAAQAAGCRRLIYLSTACVHGQAPAVGTDEASPLSDRQPIEYNNAKVRAERRLFELRQNGRLEVVALRPAIVFGPRSQWIASLAEALLMGTAHFVGDGSGICNSIYVDNLVHAISLALQSPQCDGRAYLLGDREAPTWRDFCRPVAEALGLRVEEIPEVAYHGPGYAIAPWIERVRRSQPIRTLFRSLPEPARIGLTAFYGALGGREERPHEIAPTLETALLHGCRYRLPWTRAREELGYEPQVSLGEAFRRTVGWLRYAGYPVVDGIDVQPAPDEERRHHV